MVYLPGFEEQAKKDKDEKEKSSFINELYKGTRFIHNYYPYIITLFPSSMDDSTKFAAFSKLAKKRYEEFVMNGDWDVEKFKIILWNTCLNQEPEPLAKKTLIAYELDYNYGHLESIWGQPSTPSNDKKDSTGDREWWEDLLS